MSLARVLITFGVLVAFHSSIQADDATQDSVRPATRVYFSEELLSAALQKLPVLNPVPVSELQGTTQIIGNAIPRGKLGIDTVHAVNQAQLSAYYRGIISFRGRLQRKRLCLGLHVDLSSDISVGVAFGGKERRLVPPKSKMRLSRLDTSARPVLNSIIRCVGSRSFDPQSLDEQIESQIKALADKELIRKIIDSNALKKLASAFRPRRFDRHYRSYDDGIEVLRVAPETPASSIVPLPRVRDADIALSVRLDKTLKLAASIAGSKYSRLAQIRAALGKTLWFDLDQDPLEFSFPRSGDQIFFVDPNGTLKLNLELRDTNAPDEVYTVILKVVPPEANQTITLVPLNDISQLPISMKVVSDGSATPNDAKAMEERLRNKIYTALHSLRGRDGFQLDTIDSRFPAQNIRVTYRDGYINLLADLRSIPSQ